ncbi:YDG domain-containing protein [Janthinobacterium sp. 551a]|nr:YDG domain-containing protein [Janthinobacterium sp. 551a]
MAGKYQFSGNGTGKVLNQGSISAPGGYVALLGANVSNEGTIQARLGSVALAAGRAITLDVAGDGLLNVAINAGAVGALVNNGGLIQADGGSVLLSAQAAGDLLKTVVNNTGVIEAHSIDTRGGTIKLLGDMQSGTVNAAGTLDASAPAGGNGGFIDTSAAHVNIDDALKVTTASKQGLAGTWLIDPTDFNIAARGGDMTGAFLSNSLKSGNVQIQSVSGGSGTQGNINVNDTISWSANKLTLTAQNNININTGMRGSGTASLALEYGQSSAAGAGSAYNVRAEVDLPSGNNFSTRQGTSGPLIAYTVINDLGAAGSVSGTDLQGLGLTGNYVLGSNIDARATSGWDTSQGFMPIGNTATPFTGTLDGLGHQIVGLSINRQIAQVGLFGEVGAAGIVRNLGVTGGSIQGGAMDGTDYGNVGGLAGINRGKLDNVSFSGAVGGAAYVRLGGLAGSNFGTVVNSRSAGSVVDSGYYGAAGLVSYNAAGATISNSSSSAQVTSTLGNAGGLVRYNGGAISGSFATGNVNSGSNYGGGLVGNNIDNGSITNSYATGAVHGTSSTGGLVGGNDAGSSISNSYATGKVTSNGGYVGGLVGLLRGTLSNSYATGDVQTTALAGGVVGYNVSGTITNVYTTGKVTGGGASVGAIVGEHNNGTINHAYFDSTINGSLNGVGQSFGGATSNAQGLSTAQMLVSSNYVGFNFTGTAGATGNNWAAISADGTLNGGTGTRPMLASEWSTTINSAHQLQLMAMNKAASYTLGSSFDAATTAAMGKDIWGTTGFIPVGTTASPFVGSLDGTGHIISNLNIAKSGVTDVGLFGAVGAAGAIANVGLSGSTVVGGTNVGALAGSNAGNISGSFANGSVVGDLRGGGLVGNNTGSIKDSYASGSVGGNNTMGGLVGNNGGSIASSYANGTVGASSNAGGLAGTGTGTVSGSYWDMTTSGQAASNGGAGLTTAQWKSLANYTGAGWELAQTWAVYDGQSGPYLRAFMTPIAVRVSYDNKVYDGVAYAGGSSSVSYSNVVDNGVLLGTAVFSGSAAGAVNAGTYGVSASGLYSTGGQSGYAISYIDGGLVITPKQISLNGATAGSKVYDGTMNAVLGGGSLAGVVAGDVNNVTLASLLGTYASKNVGNGINVTATATLGGSAAGNYILAPLTGITGDITPATITLSGLLAGSKVYDGLTATTLDTSGAVLTGKIGSDVLSVSGTAAFSDKNAASGKVVNITGLALGGADAGNYVLDASSASANADITAKALTITGVSAGNRVYDGTRDASLSGGILNGLVGNETLGLSGLTGTFADKDAGTNKVVSVSGATLADGSNGGLASNYTVSNPGNLAANIDKASISGVSGITAGNKVYDGLTSATLDASGATFGGKIGNDSLTVAGASGSFSDKNAANGKTVNIGGIALGGADAGNYILADATATATANIDKASISGVSGITAGNKVYDGLTSATLDASGATFGGKVGNDNLTVAGASGNFSDKNAANGKTVNIGGIALGGADAGNYTLADAGTTATATANIDKASISGVSGITAGNKVYDGGTAASLNTAAAAFGGKFGNDNLTVADASGSFSDKNAANGKTVTISGIVLGGADAGNYTLADAGTTATATANIDKASISGVSGITAGNKVYDGLTSATLDASGAVFGGKIGNDSLTVANASGSFSDKNAANGKTVNISGIALGGVDAGNYTLADAGTTATATANIGKASISGVSGITAGNKVYDGLTSATLDASGATFGGKVGNDSLTVAGASGSFRDKNAASNKVVDISGIVLGGVDAGNYELASSTASTTANIDKASISGVSGITAGNKVYDGLTSATLDASGATFGGKIGNDSLTVANASGSFSDKNAANGKIVNISGIVLGGADAGNYELASSSASTTANIGKATISAVNNLLADSKVYDGSASATLRAQGATFNGMVAGDSLSASAESAAFSDKNAGNGKMVSISGITLGGADAGNYNLLTTTGSATGDITPKALTLAGLSANNKVYDGTATAALSGGALSGLVGAETLGVTGLSAVFADKNAGAGKTVTASGATLVDGANGGLASNYTISNPTGLTADIAQALIGSVGGITAGNKAYDGSVGALLDTSGASFNGLVEGDSLGVAGASGTFSDKNAGAGKLVSITGLTLSGADAGNYVLGSTVASATADITAKVLTLSGQVAGSKVYDGNTVASLSGGVLNGLVGSETLGIAGQSASFSDKNAGNGKAVTVSGTTLVDGTGLAANYMVADPQGLTASITPATISGISGILAAGKVYDGTTKASLNLAGAAFDGMVAGDSLVLGSGTVSGVFSDKNAATGKTVSISGLGLGGQDAGNYVLASTQATATADITPASLIVRAAGGDRVYDATTNASVTLSDNRIGNDQLTVVTNGASFSDKNAGTGKTVTVNGIRLTGADAGNYTVNQTATSTADISRAVLTVKVTNAEKDQGRVNPDFNVVYTGLLGGDTVAGELGGNLVFGTTASTGSIASDYLVLASGQTSTNYTLNYVGGVLTVKPTEALRSAISNVIAAVNVAPSQGNMVQADMVATGEVAPGKPAAKGEGEQGGNAPVVQLAGNVVSNVLPGLRLSVVDSGLRLPTEAGGNNQDRQ